MGDDNDYRKNLITVQACDDHNLEKSHDDEYLHLLVIHGYFNNPLAQKQFKTKLTRAFSRRPALLAAFHSDNTQVVVDGVKTSAVTIDQERFERSIDMLVRALYFHVYGQRLLMPLRVHTPLLLDIEGKDADEVNEQVNNFCLAVRTHLEPKEPIGENTDIFWFKIDHSGKKILFHVICSFMVVLIFLLQQMKNKANKTIKFARKKHGLGRDKKRRATYL